MSQWRGPAGYLGRAGAGCASSNLMPMSDDPMLFGDTAPGTSPVQESLPAGAPLAARMRPRTLVEFVGQKHVLGDASGLRAAFERGRAPSMILWGPPGTGKTTLARLAAAAGDARFVQLSAVSAGVADLRRAVADAKNALAASGRRTVLFIDEIHRFNKGQQDAVLPYVERGDITLIGATTENPSFEVNSALLSRSRVVVLRPLEDEDILTLIDRALADGERGLANSVRLDATARAQLAAAAGGDARIALNALELSAEIAQARAGAGATVETRDIEEALQRRALRYDKAGDEHYDVISAFIKSVRGSDPDAAVYYLARMLEAGEDPLFVARRLVILSSEDIGLADAHALPLAVAAFHATHAIGMPEALYPLTEATIYLAQARKSNSGKRAYFAAKQAIEETGALPVPLHLRNAVTGLMKNLGYGSGYKYAHDFEGAMVEQQHLPDDLAGRCFYEPGDNERSDGRL
jgi:putative ATPase